MTYDEIALRELLLVDKVHAHFVKMNDVFSFNREELEDTADTDI